MVKRFEKPEKRDRLVVFAVYAAVACIALPFVALLVLGVQVYVVPHFRGVTPAQIAAEPLKRTPAALAHDLPSTAIDDRGRRVKATFLVSAGKPYAEVWFRWARSTDDTPDTMELVPEESHSPSGRTVYAALLRRMHAMHGPEYDWGGVHIKAHDEDGDLSFTVDGAASSALSEKQVDAARQVLLEAAFGLSPRFSEREIEDLLGSGYPTADVGKLDTAVPIERAAVAVYERFAAAVAKSRTEWAVPIDHPLLSAVDLSWSNEPLGTLAAAKLVTTSAFAANRATFQSCLEKKLGPPQVKVTDYAGGKKDYSFAVGDAALSITPSGLDFAPTKPGPFDPAAWSKVFAAVDACRETGEGSSLGAAKR